MAGLFRDYYAAKLNGWNQDCPDEEDFGGMFANLGNAQAQENIRQSNPASRHCDLLLASARACDGCPKNPHRSEHAQIQKRVELNARVVNDAEEMLVRHDFGLLDLRRLPFQQFTAFSSAFYARREFDETLKAKRIAFELSQFFGSKGDG